MYKIDFKWEVIEIEKDKRILMKAKYFIPITLELTLKEENKNTVVKHHLKIGYNGKRAGISERIIRKYYFTDKVIKDLDRHLDVQNYVYKKIKKKTSPIKALTQTHPPKPPHKRLNRGESCFQLDVAYS